MNKQQILTLMSYLSSSDSGDDELIYNIIKQPVIRPKIFNFIPKVVHSYSDKQVPKSILITNLCI